MNDNTYTPGHVQHCDCDQCIFNQVRASIREQGLNCRAAITSEDTIMCTEHGYTMVFWLDRVQHDEPVQGPWRLKR